MASNSLRGVESSALPHTMDATGTHWVHIRAAKDHPAPSLPRSEILSPEQLSAAIKVYQPWADCPLKAVVGTRTKARILVVLVPDQLLRCFR